jgi:methionine synthase I (cobalamin-dependent)
LATNEEDTKSEVEPESIMADAKIFFLFFFSWSVTLSFTSDEGEDAADAMKTVDTVDEVDEGGLGCSVGASSCSNELNRFPMVEDGCCCCCGGLRTIDLPCRSERCGRASCT